MMKVIVPLCVQAVSAQFGWPDDPRVVECALRDHIHPPIQRGALLMDTFGKLFEEVQCGVIENRVNRVEPQRIEVIIGNPLHRVRDEKVTDLIAVGIIEVQ